MLSGLSALQATWLVLVQRKQEDSLPKIIGAIANAIVSYDRSQKKKQDFTINIFISPSDKSRLSFQEMPGPTKAATQHIDGRIFCFKQESISNIAVFYRSVL